MLEKKFQIRTPTPHPESDHAREETFRSFGAAPCWPDGTPRWKPYQPRQVEEPAR